MAKQSHETHQTEVRFLLKNLESQGFLRGTSSKHDRLIAKDLGVTSGDALSDFRSAIKLCNDYISTFEANTFPNIQEIVQKCRQAKSLIEAEIQTRGYSDLNDRVRKDEFNIKDKSLEDTREYLDDVNRMSGYLTNSDLVSLFGFDVLKFKNEITSWTEVNDAQKDSHNPFILHLQNIERTLGRYQDNIDSVAEGIEIHELSTEQKKRVEDILSSMQAKLSALREIASVSSPISNKQKEFLDQQAAQLYTKPTPGVISEKSLTDAVIPDAILQCSGKILKLLGIDVDTIVRIAEGEPLSQKDLDKIQNGLDQIQSFLNNHSDSLRTEVRNTLKAELAPLMVAKNDKDRLKDLVVAQSKKDINIVKEQLHAAFKHLDKAFKLNGKSLEETPFGAYRLVGLECNSLEETRNSAKKLIEGYIGFWEDDLVNALIKFSPKVLADQSFGASVDVLKHVQNDSHTVTTLISDSEIARLFKEIDHDLKGKRGDEYKSGVIDALQMKNIFRDVSLKNIHNLDLTTLPEPSQAMVRLLRMSRDKVMGGGDAIPSEHADVTGLEWNKWREFVRNHYEISESLRASSIFTGSIDERLKRARDRVDNKFDEITTPLNRGLMAVNGALYNVNTGIGGIYYGINKVSGFTSILSGSGLLISSIAFPPLGVPMLALSMISTAGYFSTKGTLTWCANNASEGMNFFVARDSRFIDALRALSREAIEDEEVLLETFMAISDYLVDRFEPGNTNRANDIRFFQRKIFSSYGIDDIKNLNQGIRRDDVTEKRVYANINTWIIRGWDYADTSKEALDDIEKQIKSCGWRGLAGNDAWQKFIGEYGHPFVNKNVNKVRLSGPFPDTESEALKGILKSLNRAEFALYDDLTAAEANIFGEGTIRLVGQLIATKIKPDMMSRMAVINGIRKQLDEMLPEKLGGRYGRNQQLVAKSWTGWGAYQLSGLNEPKKKAA